jgi:hypothetical protein
MRDPESNPPPSARQGHAWTEVEDRRLYDSFLAGQLIDAMAAAHQRSTGAIHARLRRLGLINENGEVVEPPPPFAVPPRRRSNAVEDLGADDDKQPMHLVFALMADDGWRIEIRSNRPFNKVMVERLRSMLPSAPEGGA